MSSFVRVVGGDDGGAVAFVKPGVFGVGVGVFVPDPHRSSVPAKGFR